MEQLILAFDLLLWKTCRGITEGHHIRFRFFFFFNFHSRVAELLLLLLFF